MNENKLDEWRKLSSERVGSYAIFDILCRRFENVTKGKIGDFFMIDCNDWVQVVAEADDGRVVLVEQYRFGVENFSLEFPGGGMEPGEDPVEAAKRELEEETGFCGESAEVISKIYPNPAIQTNAMHVVLVKNCRRMRDTNFDEFEDLSTSLLTRRELLDAIATGKIYHCIAIAAVMKYVLLGSRSREFENIWSNPQAT
ncbi:MAG: NUDIX hydrolase [Puniceicoccales bacterium]|jgi:8-oxo-dGTP pyrophosphatase MutT (NUDIX family)|nr:NUDIX hydrolase [Puniceicoccales bacterium]